MSGQIERRIRELDKIIKEKNKEQDPYLKERRELYDKQLEQKINKLMGRCFIYKNNSYSCPKTGKDYWDVYYKAIGKNKEGSLLLLSISKNRDGLIELRTREEYSLNFLKEYCKEIKEEDFNKVFEKLLKEIKK